jgi:hypothetical protein
MTVFFQRHKHFNTMENQAQAPPEENSAFPEPRFFLDSADLRQWETRLPAGLFFGVTTNPVLLRDAGQSCSCDNLELLFAVRWI